jgi:hypothetical protein
MLARRYGKAPHEFMEIDDVHFALDWEVLTRAEAAEGGNG